jgi:hypothetical protein
LLDRDEPAWPLVLEWIAEAVVPVEVLPRSEHADDELLALQVTTRSPMGAITHESGGLLVDGGWLKVLGGGHPRLPWSVAGITRALGFWPDPDAPPPLLVVGIDVIGGLFAIDGTALGGPGHVHYFAPDDLAWMDCETPYTGWLTAFLNGATEDFYSEMRWPGWQKEVAALAPDRGIAIEPMLCADEAKAIEDRSRAVVPLFELAVQALEMGAQEREPPD